MDRILLKLLANATEENVDLLKMLTELQNKIQFLCEENNSLKKELEIAKEDAKIPEWKVRF